jgi:hypothetical protein
VQVFRSTCHFEARESQDYVYALLGLSEVSSTAFELKPQYRSNLQQLYVDLVYHHLVKSPLANRLDFLAHAGIGYAHNTPGLPSWAPDWSVKSASQPLFGTEGSLELLASSKTTELLTDAAQLASVVYTDQDKQKKDLYNAALNQAAQVKDQTLALLFDATRGMEPYARILEGNVLELRALKLGRVRAVGRCYEMPESGNSQGVLGTLTEWVRLALASAKSERARVPGFSTHFGTSLATGLDEAQAAASQSFAEVLCTSTSNGQVDYTFTSTPHRVDPTFARLTEELFEKVILADKVERLTNKRLQNIVPNDVVEGYVDRILHNVIRTYAAAVSQNCKGKRFGIIEWENGPFR